MLLRSPCKKRSNKEIRECVDWRGDFCQHIQQAPSVLSNNMRDCLGHPHASFVGLLIYSAMALHALCSTYDKTTDFLVLLLRRGLISNTLSRMPVG